MKRRPSPAFVLAFIALCVALAGTAFAATKIGTKNLKNGAVSTKKLKNKAVTTGKLANSSVTAAKLAPNAVTGVAIAPGSVTANDLASGVLNGGGSSGGGASNGGPGFVAKTTGQVAIAAGIDPTTVLQLSLPSGNSYIVNSQATIGNQGNTPGSFINCSMTRNNGPFANSTYKTYAGAQFTGTIAMTGAIDDGGTVRLICLGDSSALAKDATITAVRVSSLTGP